MEFNCQNIFISDLIDNMNIKHSIPYINIFNLHKIPFNRYIKSYCKEKNYNYSKWADLIEEDFKKLDKYIVCLYKNEPFSDDFNFKITESFHLS